MVLRGAWACPDPFYFTFTSDISVFFQAASDDVLKTESVNLVLQAVSFYSSCVFLLNFTQDWIRQSTRAQLCLRDPAPFCDQPPHSCQPVRGCCLGWGVTCSLGRPLLQGCFLQKRQGRDCDHDHGRGLTAQHKPPCSSLFRVNHLLTEFTHLNYCLDAVYKGPK